MPISCGSIFGYGQLEPLEQTLKDFMKDEVDYGSKELQTIHVFLKKFTSQLNQVLTSDNEVQGLALSRVIPIGWAWEPKLTCRVNQYDILVVFRLGCKEEQWSCTKITTEDVVYTSHPHIIRRRSPDLDDVTPEYKSKMAAFGNKLYLNEVHYDQFDPVKFHRKAKDFVLAHLRDFEVPPMKDMPDFEFEIMDAKPNSPALRLKVKFAEEELIMNLIPTVEVVQFKTEVSVGWIWSYNIAKEKFKLMIPKLNHWRRCYLTEDEVFLTEFRNKKYRILNEIYKIIKTITSNKSTPLSKLDSYVYKHFIMKIVKKFTYCYHKISLKEAFKMLLVQLEEIFRLKNLEHFNEGYNLLNQVEPSTLVFLSGYLKSVIDSEDYLEFLIENKTKVPHQIDGELLLLEQAKNYFGSLEKTSEKNLFTNIDIDFKNILEDHFKRDDIVNRISVSYNSIITSNLGNYPTNSRLLIIFELDGNLWLPKAEYDPQVLEDDFVPYHCTWAKYTDDFNQNNQALKYGKDENLFQMDSIKFTSTINGEIQSALHNYYLHNENIKLNSTIHLDHVEVRVKFETTGQNLTYDVIPSISFFNNEQIPPNFLLVNPKVALKSYWMRNYDLQTLDLVQNMDKHDDGCRKDVLDVLLTALSPTPLSKLRGDVILGAVLNNRYHYGWRKDTKMVKFILDYLVDVLDRKDMPHHLESLRNVLKSYDDELLSLCADYLRAFKANSFKPSTYHFLLYRKEIN